MRGPRDRWSDYPLGCPNWVLSIGFGALVGVLVVYALCWVIA